ncbi:hypothetical protein FY210_05070 [Anaplasma marginale]|nr:hypothetical protein FY210_05070 [Anaplasma marginale]
MQVTPVQRAVLAGSRFGRPRGYEMRCQERLAALGGAQWSWAEMPRVGGTRSWKPKVWWHREFGDRDYVHGYTTCVSEKHYAYQEYGGERHGLSVCKFG